MVKDYTTSNRINSVVDRVVCQSFVNNLRVYLVNEKMNFNLHFYLRNERVSAL